MKKIVRRDKLKIYGDLLFVLHYDLAPGKICLSQVGVKINVPYDRLKLYIKDLVDLGLLEDETSLKLTKKGKHYLREYKRVLDFISYMGFSYR